MGVEFQFCAPTMDHVISRNFKDYYRADDDETVMLKPKLQKPSFKPPMSASYDSEFSELSQRADSMRAEIMQNQTGLKTLREQQEQQKGNLVTDIWMGCSSL